MIITQPATFEQMWSAIADIGRDPITGGYRRFAWTAADLSMREWFSGECAARGLDLTEDRMGNQWAWWGDPDSSSSGGVVDRFPSGQRSGRGSLRRPTRRGQRISGDRPAAG